MGMLHCSPAALLPVCHSPLPRRLLYSNSQSLSLSAGYLGFLANVLEMDISQVTLTKYRNMDLFVRFIGYLLDRRVGRDHVVKHITICRRVCRFLGRAECGNEESERRTEQWLMNLQHQLQVSMPKTPHGGMAAGPDIYRHVSALVARARFLIRRDAQVQGVGELTVATATAVQVAVLAMLITGSDIPPCR
jgi:hypothetical protein